MHFALVLKLCSLVTGECRNEVLETDAVSSYACYIQAPRIISVAMPEVLSDEGMGEDKLKMERFTCRQN